MHFWLFSLQIHLDYASQSKTGLQIEAATAAQCRWSSTCESACRHPMPPFTSVKSTTITATLYVARMTCFFYPRSWGHYYCRITSSRSFNNWACYHIPFVITNFLPPAKHYISTLVDLIIKYLHICSHLYAAEDSLDMFPLLCLK